MKRDECVAWERLGEGSTIRDILLNSPIYWWPKPHANTYFHASCIYKLMEKRGGHLQTEHQRQRKIADGPEESNSKMYVCDGESPLTATTADLLGVTVITPHSAKYGNQVRRKLGTFKAPGEIW
jgi:hypothetical protein